MKNIGKYKELYYDAALAVISVPIAFFLRTNIAQIQHEYLFILEISLLYGVCCFFSLFVFRLQYRLWIYTSIQDIITLVYSVGLSVLVWFLLVSTINNGGVFPKSMPILVLMVNTLLSCGGRILFRFVAESANSRKLNNSGLVPVFLIGDVNASDKAIAALKSPVYAHYIPVGIIETDPRKVGKSIRGVRVIGVLKDIDQILLSESFVKPKLALFVNSSLDKQISSEVFRKLTNAGIVSTFLPSLSNQGGINPGSEQKLNYNLLLKRSAFDINFDNIFELIKGKRVMVTGGGGSIGSEIVRKVATSDPESLIILDSSEHFLYLIDHEISVKYDKLDKHGILVDVRDKTGVNNAMKKYKPDLVFHAAAIKHVPLSEANPGYAFDVNVLGTRNVFDAAKQNNVQLTTMISTDKAVNPSSIMGATKQIAEMLCLAMSEDSDPGHKFLTVRFGNVIGSNGSVLPLFEKQIDEGGPVTITHEDITRFFMSIDEAVNLVLQASHLRYINTIDDNNGICVLNMGDSVLIKDIAEQLILLKGKQPYKDIDIVYTGLRPGEKLYEELFSSYETVMPTVHDWLSIASSNQKRSFHELYDGIQEISLAIKNSDNELIKSLIKKLSINFYENHI